MSLPKATNTDSLAIFALLTRNKPEEKSQSASEFLVLLTVSFAISTNVTRIIDGLLGRILQQYKPSRTF